LRIRCFACGKPRMFKHSSPASWPEYLTGRGWAACDSWTWCTVRCCASPKGWSLVRCRNARRVLTIVLSQRFSRRITASRYEAGGGQSWS
jgi:hypothetical protein